MVLEPMIGWAAAERAPGGEEWVIGRLTRVCPPEGSGLRLVSSGSPAAPTAVDIALRRRAGGTEIRIVHKAPSEGAIAAWPGKVALFERGWDTV